MALGVRSSQFPGWIRSHIGGFGAPQVYADLLAYYKILGHERGTPDVSDVSRHERAKAVMVSGSPGDWVPNHPYGWGIQTDGSAKYLELEDNLFDSMADGAIVMRVKSVSGSNSHLISTVDGTTFKETFTATALNTASILTFKTETGGVSEALTLVGGAVFDDWVVYGFEWGALGKRMYVNGALAWSNAGLVSGTGIDGVKPRIGRDNAAFSKLTITDFLLYDRQIGDASHKDLNQFLAYMR